ncbi:MAG: hypothetical protein LC800_06140 [Acidobacteria bacterium]|nr:hypothetical protein [Acidobacteriota bacterium]
MRPEFDSQLDSLLREHARRGGLTPPGGDAPAARDARGGEREFASAAHLDADELGAFAENALPASARARHTAHLADCGDCRRLVSQIALASGVAEEIERREPSPAVGLAAAAVARRTPAWRERVASLFRPGAWRYALPLAALLVVSASVLLLMSGRRRDELDNLAAGGAKSRPSQPAEMHHPAQQGRQTDPAAASQNTATNDTNANAEVGLPGALASDTATNEGFSKIAPPAPAGGGGSPAASAESAKSADAEARPPAATFAAEPVSVPTPSPLPPPPARQTSEPAATVSRPAPVKPEDNKAAENKEKDRYDDRNAAPAQTQRGHGPMRNETQQQMNARNRQAVEAQAADAAPRAAPKSEAESSRAADSTSTRGSRAAGAAAARGEGRREKSGAGRGDDGGETRSVGGRRFRRQGDAWVDTSYRASQATVQIGRGSEQYRSLVGDEPEVGRIANALGGEVVVVWKGRAYRIR